MIAIVRRRITEKYRRRVPGVAVTFGGAAGTPVSTATISVSDRAIAKTPSATSVTVDRPATATIHRDRDREPVARVNVVIPSLDREPVDATGLSRASLGARVESPACRTSDL